MDSDEGALDKFLGTFVPCAPPSINHLDKMLIILAANGFFADRSLVGAWITGPDSFCIVHRAHDSETAIGFHASLDSNASTPEFAVASAVAAVTPSDVARWKDHGWSRDGVAWNSAPPHLTPWSGEPPVATSPPMFPDRTAAWAATPGRSEEDRIFSPPLVGDMWSTTALINMVTTRNFIMIGPSTRLSGCWAAAPDAAVLIYEYAVDPIVGSRSYPGETHHATMRRVLPRGQRYLRVGRFFAPSSPESYQFPYSRFAFENLQADTSEHENAFYPESLIRDTREDCGVHWFEPHPEVPMADIVQPLLESIRSIMRIDV